MSDLERRVRALLPRLHLLMEGTTSKRPEPKPIRPTFESRAPANTHPDRTGPPSPDDSLLLYFLDRYGRATTPSAKVAVVAEVEIRLLKRVDGKAPRAVAGSNRDRSTTVDSAERDRRIAEDYVDLGPAEVSAIESEAYGWCPAANVRRVRALAAKDTETGRPRAEQDTDRAYALELRAAGHSIGSIAMRLAKPKSTIQRWVAKRAA